VNNSVVATDQGRKRNSERAEKDLEKKEKCGR
jgi:hypothetical protein